MKKSLSENLRNVGYEIGGKLLNSNYFFWILFLLRKIGIVRLVHAILDKIEAGHPTEEMLEFRKMRKTHKQELKRVYKLLEDEKSKKVYKDIICYRCTKDRKYLTRHIDKDIYFNELTNQGEEKEIFVDGGAFNGDTIRMFYRANKGKYGHIYAFEVEETNILKMKSMICKKKMPNITIEPYALWNKKETLHVSGTGMISQVADQTDGPTDTEIEADSLDNLLKDREITYIKMDIEGAELEALEGAQDIICTYKPKLAISIYHKIDDFYKIPLFIHKLVPEYKLYVRHYTCFYADTVLYAIYN